MAKIAGPHTGILDFLNAHLLPDRTAHTAGNAQAPCLVYPFWHLRMALLIPSSIQIAGKILSNTLFLGDDRWGGVWTSVELYKWGMKSRDYKGLIYEKAKCSFATYTLNFDTAVFVF